MPTIHDRPPPDVQSDLDYLKAALNSQIPIQSDNNLLIATWNIRSFGSLTRKWTASDSDIPKRDLRGLRAIIEIVSRFDVIAIQEIKSNLRALRDMMAFLGDQWAFLMTDVNVGDAGNDERFAFLFNRSRIRPSGLAAEIVIPIEQIHNSNPDVLHEQFVRSPYAVSFQRGKATFILVTLHVKYGKNEEERLAELKGVAQWMENWALRLNRYHHNLLTLGDFNIDRAESAGHIAFTSTGLSIPEVLINKRRTIFDKLNKPNKKSFYDQIAWFISGKKALLSMELKNGGHFDFLPYVYTDLSLTRNQISFRISDHYPLWVEFEV